MAISGTFALNEKKGAWNYDNQVSLNLFTSNSFTTSFSAFFYLFEFLCMEALSS